MFEDTAFIGCSFTYGHGLQDRSLSFPGILKGINLGECGASNKQIFENAVQALVDHQQIIVQWTISGRAHFTSTAVPIAISLNEPWQSNFEIPKKLWDIFKDVYKIVQNDFDDFTNLKKYVNILDNLANCLNKKVYYINGLMNIKQEYMTPPFTKTTKRYNDVLSFVDDEKNWINTSNSLRSMSIDDVSAEDIHPGVKSHRLYADMIVQYMNKKDKE